MAELEKIRKAAILEFDEKGPRFTMDDLSKRLGMSKKTLYEVVRDKEQLFELMVEDAWASIKAQEAAIVSNKRLGPVEKLRRVICIMPALGASLDYRKVRELEELYPAVGERIEAHIEADWDVTLGLYDAAVAEGLLRRVDRELLKLVLFSTMEEMLRGDFLQSTGRGYEKTLLGVVDMLLDGLRS